MNEDGRGFSWTNQFATAVPVDCTRVRERRVRFLSVATPAAAFTARAATGTAAGTAAGFAAVFAAFAARFPTVSFAARFAALATLAGFVALIGLGGFVALTGLAAFADFVTFTDFERLAAFAAGFFAFAGLALVSFTLAAFFAVFDGLADAGFVGFPAEARFGRAAAFFAALFFALADAFFAFTLAIPASPAKTLEKLNGAV